MPGRKPRSAPAGTSSEGSTAPVLAGSIGHRPAAGAGRRPRGRADQHDIRHLDFIHTRDLVDFSAYRGHTIGTLTFVTLPIFNEQDPRENNAVYRFLNRTHILTKPGPIERQLLFRAGEPLDDKIIYESERILRGDNFLYDAMVLPGEV